MGKRAGVLDEVAAERRVQDEQWGGSQHDDSHALLDWLDFIERQVARSRAKTEDQNRRLVHIPELRRRLVKVAALAVAGIESIDRQYPF